MMVVTQMDTIAYIEPKILEPFMLSLSDYVMAVVINQVGQALVFEGACAQSGVLSWQVLSRDLGDGENPIKAVQHELYQHLGHNRGEWIYLGSYENCPGRVGHLFCAKDVTCDDLSQPLHAQARWVPLPVLRQALLDGRFSDISIAANVALTLFMLPSVS